MPEPLQGGELNAAVTSALVGIHNQYLGRGPKTASTFHHGNVLVTLMNDVLNHAEKSLSEAQQTDAVTHMRHLFQATMEVDFRAAVERLTGRKSSRSSAATTSTPTSPPNCSFSTDHPEPPEARAQPLPRRRTGLAGGTRDPIPSACLKARLTLPAGSSLDLASQRCGSGLASRPRLVSRRAGVG
jgi:uncharacterized protein YbcI